MEGAHLALELRRRPAPVERAFLLAELVGVGDAFLGLRRRIDRAGASARRASTRSGVAPSSASRSCTVSAVSAAEIGVRSASSIGPVSRPSSMRMVVTPVSASPARIARWIGAAPRQRGSSEPWMLMQPSTGASRNALVQDMAVGHDHRGIEIERLEGRGFLVGLERLRRAHRQGRARRASSMHRRLALLLAAAGGLGRARVDGDHVVAGVDQRLQRGHGEFRCTEKRNLHRGPYRQPRRAELGMPGNGFRHPRRPARGRSPTLPPGAPRARSTPIPCRKRSCCACRRCTTSSPPWRASSRPSPASGRGWAWRARRSRRRDRMGSTSGDRSAAASRC